MSRKNKHYRKKMYREYLEKKNDTGFRHFHCPVCFNNTGELIEATYDVNGYWNCSKCNSQWTIVA